jgi:hypothetical protein
MLMQKATLEMAKIEIEDALPVRSPEEWARMNVDRWKILGPMLEEQREQDVRRSDTKSNIAAFSRLFTMAIASRSPSEPASYIEYVDGISLRICSAEDLIVMKRSLAVSRTGTTCL